MADKKDWFKVYRSLLTDKMWLSEPFTKGQAWVDIIGRANYGTTEHISGPHCIRIYRGQLPTSVKALAERWKWSRAKVDNFLAALSEAQMVSIKKTSNGTTITIENYALYQDGIATDFATKKHQNDIKKASDFAHKKKDKEETKNTQEYGCEAPPISSPKEGKETGQSPVCNSPTLMRLVKEWGVELGPAAYGGKNETGTN